MTRRDGARRHSPSTRPDEAAFAAAWLAQVAAAFASDAAAPEAAWRGPLRTVLVYLSPATHGAVADAVAVAIEHAVVANTTETWVNVAEKDVPAAPLARLYVRQAPDRTCLLSPPAQLAAPWPLPFPSKEADVVVTVAKAVSIVNRHCHRHRTPSGARTPHVRMHRVHGGSVVASRWRRPPPYALRN